MLLDIRQYNLHVIGVLHIGAFIGEEQLIYDCMNIKNILYFEPLTRHVQQLKQRIPQAQVAQTALGNYNGTATMNVSHTAENGRPWYQRGDGASSSLLKPKKHLDQHKNIDFPTTEEVPICKLDYFIQQNNIDTNLYNMINIDVQGYELEVFKGARATLQNIKYVLCEVNKDEVYENCAMVEEIDQFLSHYNLVRVETNWAGGIWGDALYVKQR